MRNYDKQPVFPEHFLPPPSLYCSLSLSLSDVRLEPGLGVSFFKSNLVTLTFFFVFRRQQEAWMGVRVGSGAAGHAALPDPGYPFVLEHRHRFSKSVQKQGSERSSRF